MSTVNHLPEHILHDILSVVVDATKSAEWQISLRLVNRNFNEATLHVYYLQKKLKAEHKYYTLLHKAWNATVVPTRMVPRPKVDYAMRFDLQRSLTMREPPGDITYHAQLIRQIRAALTILRASDGLQPLHPSHASLYSTCSENSVWNDIGSAVMAEAARSCLNRTAIFHLTYHGLDCEPKPPTPIHPPEFWVAASACILEDLRLFETYFNKLGSTGTVTPTPAFPELSINHQLASLLSVAIYHGNVHVIKQVLKANPEIMFDQELNYLPLQTAVTSPDNEVLKLILAYTPSSSSLLARVLCPFKPLLTQSDKNSETIRLLAQHFTPLTTSARRCLITESCNIGDVTLLQELSATGPLFGREILDSGEEGPIFSTEIHFTVRYGHVECLRFLITHGILDRYRVHAHRMAIEHAALFDQLECYQVLYESVTVSQLYSSTWYSLALANNAKDKMAEFLSDEITRDARMIPDWPMELQSAWLWTSIKRLRHENIQFLIDRGTPLFPIEQRPMFRWLGLGSKDPFEIPWAYFNKNREAYRRTQVLLDRYGLPQLRTVV